MFFGHSRQKAIVKKLKKIKPGIGAKHSDIKVNAFYQNLPPECFAPTAPFLTKKIYYFQQLETRFFQKPGFLVFRAINEKLY